MKSLQALLLLTLSSPVFALQAEPFFNTFCKAEDDDQVAFCVGAVMGGREVIQAFVEGRGRFQEMTEQMIEQDRRCADSPLGHGDTTPPALLTLLVGAKLSASIVDERRVEDFGATVWQWLDQFCEKGFQPSAPHESPNQ